MNELYEIDQTLMRIAAVLEERLPRPPSLDEIIEEATLKSERAEDGRRNASELAEARAEKAKREIEEYRLLTPRHKIAWLTDKMIETVDDKTISIERIKIIIDACETLRRAAQYDVDQAQVLVAAAVPTITISVNWDTRQFEVDGKDVSVEIINHLTE